MMRRLVISLAAVSICGVLAAPPIGVATVAVGGDYGDDCSMSQSGGGRWVGCNGVTSAWRNVLQSQRIDSGFEAGEDEFGGFVVKPVPN